MDRSKLIAIVTGAISLLLAVGYLVLVQLLDFRGDMVPAPLSTLSLGWPHSFSPIAIVFSGWL
ncbi:MAG: glucose-inhibited division protein A [Leptolyngbya sp. DLM2.Bin27]|nr:MAG: glucose-inhibited division protein A [Leptolyngbya sp. DLM2.Bin27]